jgi:hypothetical protein
MQDIHVNIFHLFTTVTQYILRMMFDQAKLTFYNVQRLRPRICMLSFIKVRYSTISLGRILPSSFILMANTWKKNCTQIQVEHQPNQEGVGEHDSLCQNTGRCRTARAHLTQRNFPWTISCPKHNTVMAVRVY